MSGYIRLPRDSEDSDGDAICSPHPERRTSIRLGSTHMRVFGAFYSIAALVVTAICVVRIHGHYSSGSPPLLAACIVSVIVNGASGLWTLSRWALRKWVMCEDCKQRAAQIKAPPYILFVVVDSIVSVLALGSSIAQLVISTRRFRFWSNDSDIMQASGFLGLGLCFIHAIIALSSLYPEIQFDVHLLGKQLASEAPQAAMAGREYIREVDSEAQPLKPVETGSSARKLQD